MVPRPGPGEVPAPLGPGGISGLHPSGGVKGGNRDGGGWQVPRILETETMALSDGERAHLERRLQEERARVAQILDRSVADQSSESEQDRTGDLTKVPFHPADLGSDAMEAELAASNATRLSSELAAIDEALERLYRTPEDFGLCQDTGVEIPLARLDIIPWARTCDEAGA
jgi:DnaK suppressor protein